MDDVGFYYFDIFNEKLSKWGSFEIAGITWLSDDLMTVG